MLLIVSKPINAKYENISTNVPLNPSLNPLNKIQNIKITLPVMTKFIRIGISFFIFIICFQRGHVIIKQQINQ
jgi:hypothetical protein